MIEDIKSWLNGNQNLNEGISMIEKHELKILKPKHLLTKQDVFKVLRTTFAQQKGKVYQPDISTKETAPTTTIENDIVREAKAKADMLYKEMSNKRAVLFSMCPKKKETLENEGQKVKHRAQLTVEIMDLHYQIDQAYDQYLFAKQNGRLPEQVIHDVVPTDLYRQISNCRKYISKLKGRETLTARQQDTLIRKAMELEALLKLDAIND